MGTSEQVNQFKRIQPFVEIMDSTLRDGEQTSGVSFLPHEKLMIARMLLNDLNVDRIEVASARVSEGEREAVSMICRYAAKIDKLERVEVLGFIDGGKSVDWAAACGCRTVNLLAKGSLKHCIQQLNKQPDEHIEDIRREVRYARSKGIAVNLYLEDWSNGMKESAHYVYDLMDALCDVGIRRFMLPDTLGIMSTSRRLPPPWTRASPRRMAGRCPAWASTQTTQVSYSMPRRTVLSPSIMARPFWRCGRTSAARPPARFG